MNIRTFFAMLVMVALVTFLGLSPVFAATTPTPTATSSAVADAEIEREKQITKELSLNMPDQTEDPNYPVTFVDPSKQGVDITIDEKATTKAPNPFLLPNLAIGEHRVIFKFKTKDGVVRVLAKKLLVTPKAPQFDQTLKTEVVRPNSVTLKGTALPQATVMIIINSDKTHKITSSIDGKWEFIVPEPLEGTNNIVAFTIKSGIVSNVSKTFSVIYKLNETNTGGTITGTIKENQILDFAKVVISNIDANRIERPTIFYGAIGGALLVILLLVDLRLRKRAAKNRDEKTIAALFGTLQKDGGTIVDAIQSATQTVFKKKGKKSIEEKPQAAPKIKKALAALEEELSSTPEGTDEVEEAASKETATTTQEEVTEENVTETPAVPAVLAEEVVVEPKTKQPKPTKKADVTKTLAKAEPAKTEPVKTTKVTKSAPLVAEPEATEISEETEEPEKKTLSKEEFLKQFQKGSGQDE